MVPEDGMTLKQFMQASRETNLTEKQAKAFYRRRVEQKSRERIAIEMVTSESNIDNLESKARNKIQESITLIRLLDAVGYEYNQEFGICDECGEEAKGLTPDSKHDGNITEGRLVCPDCKEPRAGITPTNYSEDE